MSNLAVLERESENPASFTWRIPGAPVQVRLAFSVVKDLQSQLDTPGGMTAEQGLLWGKAVGGITDIHAFTAIPGSKRPSPSDVAASVPPSGVSVPVGYYRLHHDANLRLNDDDIALAKAVFPDPYQVLLLIQPREFGPAAATFFFWDEGRMLGDFPFLEFDFDHSILTAAEKKKIQARKQDLLAESRLAHAQVSDPPPRRKPALKIVFWSVLASLLVIASLVMAFTGRFPARSRPPVTSVASPPPPSSPAPATVSGSGTLGFHAERQKGDLRLTWNRESDVIRNATSGELSIQDTGGTRQVLLDPAHIRTGTILYAPTADQIQMQLTIVSPRVTASESVIVILPKRGALRVQPVVHSERAATATVPARPDQRATPGRVPNKAFVPPVATAAQANRSSVAQAPVLPAGEPPVANLKTDPVRVTLPGTTQAAVPPPRPAPGPSTPAPPAAVPQTTIPQTTAPQTAVSEAAPPSPERPPAQSAAPVYFPAVIASSVTPAYPPELRSMDLPTKVVQVKVSIDASGRVIKADPVPDQIVPQPMIAASLNAAWRWKFTPARKNSLAIPSEMILRFEFKRPK